MAVKVLGEIDPEAVHRTTCRNCASRLEYTMADTRRETVRDYDGGSDDYTRLTCPKCGATVTV